MSAEGYDDLDLTQSGTGGCPACDVPLQEGPAGYYGCPECLGVWAGDPERADLVHEPIESLREGSA
jgi:hypothetical protein